MHNFIIKTLEIYSELDQKKLYNSKDLSQVIIYNWDISSFTLSFFLMRMPENKIFKLRNNINIGILEQIKQILSLKIVKSISNNNINVRYQQLQDEKKYEESQKLINQIKPLTTLYSDPTITYNSAEYYELIVHTLTFQKPLENSKILNALNQSINRNLIENCALFLLSYFIRYKQYKKVIELSLQLAQQYQPQKSVEKGKKIVQIALSSINNFLLEIKLKKENDPLQQKLENLLEDESDSYDSDKEKDDLDFAEKKMKFIQDNLENLLETDYQFKQSQCLQIYRIKKEIILQKQNHEQLQKLVKQSSDLPLKVIKVETFSILVYQFEFESAYKQLQDIFKYFSQLLTSNEQNINIVLQTLNEMTNSIIEIFKKKNYLVQLNNEWIQKYYEQRKKEESKEEGQFQNNILLQAQSKSSFSSDQNFKKKKNFMDNMPQLSQFFHCLNQFDDKVQTHTDLLIGYYKLIAQQIRKQMEIVKNYQNMLGMKYNMTLQQLKLVYTLTLLSAITFSFDESQNFIPNIKTIEDNEIKLFNEEFQNFIRDFHNEFLYSDLIHFCNLLSQDSYKWLFKRVHDKYEKTLQSMMQKSEQIKIEERKEMLSLFLNCTQLFENSIFPLIMNLNMNLIFQELLQYYDEVITITQSMEQNSEILEDAKRIIISLFKGFRMIRQPINYELNYYLQSQDFKEKQGQTNLFIIMGDRFTQYSILELYLSYQILQKIPKSKAQNQCNLFLQLNLIEQYSKYFLLDDQVKYYSQLDTDMFTQCICGIIVELTALKINIKRSYSLKLRRDFEKLNSIINSFLLVDQYHQIIDTQYQFQIRRYFEIFKFLGYFQTFYEKEDLKQIYVVYKQIKLTDIFRDILEINQTVIDDINNEDYEKKWSNKPLTQEELLNQKYEVFGLSLPILVCAIGEINSQVHLLQTKQYNEFLEQQYFMQLNLLKSITIHLRKNYYYKQMWKYICLLIDVTSRVINQQELFQISFTNFKDEGLQRSQFSFSHIERGLKILRIIIEETIFKIFTDPQALQNQNDNSQNDDFKPQLKVIFHGIEDLNIENPRQGQLDLEIVMQTSKDQYVRLRVQENQIRWGYEQLEKLNFVVNILLPLIQNCMELWIQFLPKIFLEYQEFILKKSQISNLEEAIIQQWLLKEKDFVKNSQDGFFQFLDSLEFSLMKTEGSLLKEVQYYNNNEKPFNLQFENASKYFIEQGLDIDYNLMDQIQYRIVQQLKKQLDSYITPLKNWTQKIKSYTQTVKKLYSIQK